MIEFIQKHQNKIYLTAILLLFAFYCFFLFYRLGVHPIIDWDESIYAEVARDALHNNHWLNFQFYGQPWYEKPPLGLWLVSWSFAIGGVNEFMARLPSVLATVATVILSLRWVYEIRKKYLPVLLAMVAYYIMYTFLIDAFFLNLDTMVGFSVLLSLYAWWNIFIVQRTAEKTKQFWFLVWGASIGIGVMTKNIVGFFPLVPIAIYMLAQRDLSFLKDKRFWYGVVLAVLIILPWHIYQSLVAGKAFWNEYFVYHVLQRYSSVIATNGHSFWYFIDLIFLRYREALVVFGGSVLVSVYLAWKSKTARYLLISTLALLLIFSLSTTKLPGYIAMVLPLLVMLSGLSLAQLINWIPKIWLKILVTVILSVTLVYTGFQFNKFKVVKSESEFEYLDSEEVGLFLKAYHPELPIYLNTPLNNNLVIAYYSNRPLLEIQTDLPGIDTKLETKEVILRTGTKLVLLGQNYILVLR